jgi:hypothetical protein
MTYISNVSRWNGFGRPVDVMLSVTQDHPNRYLDWHLPYFRGAKPLEIFHHAQPENNLNPY